MQVTTNTNTFDVPIRSHSTDDWFVIAITVRPEQKEIIRPLIDVYHFEGRKLWKIRHYSRAVEARNEPATQGAHCIDMHWRGGGVDMVRVPQTV